MTCKEKKPLFVPLNTEYFNAFKDGSKTEELRRYGKRWNKNTCYLGRKVILSKGYGKYERLSGEISEVRKYRATELCLSHRNALKAIYGTLDIYICCFHIINLKEVDLT